MYVLSLNTLSLAFWAIFSYLRRKLTVLSKTTFDYDVLPVLSVIGSGTIINIVWCLQYV